MHINDEPSLLKILPVHVFAGSLESQLIGLFSVRQFFRDLWRGAFSQYFFRNVLMLLGVELSNVAGKVIICDKNVSASGGGRFQKLSSISSKNCRAYRAYRAYRGIDMLDSF